jgi:hypothetical protein
MQVWRFFGRRPWQVVVAAGPGRPRQSLPQLTTRKKSPEKLSRALHFNCGAWQISRESLRQTPAVIANETKLQFPAGIIVLYAGGVRGATGK